MADLKPLGSERLEGDEKLKRIMELATYGRTNKSTITENNQSHSVEFIKESTTGVYGITKEKNSYYVKKGLNEGSLDYIGGMFMKDKNRFTSYADALKRLELISGQESLTEAKKYILKGKEKPVEAVAPSEPMAELPPPAAPAPSNDDPVDDAPIEDLPMDDAPMGDEPMGDEEGKPSDYMAEVQKFSGKLGQALRDAKVKMESDDIKYVINMVLSAVDLNKLDEEDREEIAERFEPNEDDGLDSVDDAPMGDEPMGDEESPEVEDELGEIMDKLESFVNTPVESMVDTSDLEEDDSVLDMADDLGSEEHSDELEDIEEIDLDEIKSQINKHVDETLSKYFK